MSIPARRPSFNSAQHPSFAGKSPPRPTTAEHRVSAIAAPPKPSTAPAWKAPNPERSLHNNTPPKVALPETASYRQPDTFGKKSKSKGPGFGGTLEAHKAPFSGLGD